MTFPDNAGEDFPAGLPRLDVTLIPATAADWSRIMHRARGRRRRAVAAGVVAVVAVSAVPALALLPERQRPLPTAHRLADGFNGVCDVAYTEPAATGDRITHPFRVGEYLITPPGDSSPSIDATTLRERVERRRGGQRLEPGTQLRYGVVRRISSSGRVMAPQLRWILTTCGVPQKQFLDPTSRPRVPSVPEPMVEVPTDRVLLLSDSGAETHATQAGSFNGVCDSRLDAAAPRLPIRYEFYVGEIKVSPPPKGARLEGRAAAERSARRLHGTFPGTQIRLGLVEPLHERGSQRLRWLVTTCGLDGQSVRPRVVGAVNEALVFDASGRLLAEHRSGARSDGELYARQAPALPNPVPTYVPTGPNICGMWSMAYPDFKVKAAAAGYTDMQGCSRTQDSVIIFVSSATRGAAVAVVTSSGAEYQSQYDKRFPFSVFRFIPAPDGARTARLLRYLTPRVAEVELSGPGVPARSHKFDARELRWLDCDDRVATRQDCRGR